MAKYWVPKYVFKALIRDPGCKKVLGETGMRKRVDDIQHLMTYYVHHVIQFNYLLICGNIIGHVKFTSSLLRRKTEVNF